MKIFVIGDIHGAYKALLQCLERSNFNKETDVLICLGDVADGWSQVPECFDELLTLNKFIYIMGNHDKWLLEWFIYGASPYIWTSQGGKATIDSYIKRYKTKFSKNKENHRELLQFNAVYHFVLNNKLFVHGGYNWHYPIEYTSPTNKMWDRHLFETAVYWQRKIDRGLEKEFVKDYDEIFIGHTSTSYYWKDMKPVHVSNVWNLDQGVGWNGKLTIMNVETKEYWQSDVVKELYPEEKGRG